MKSKKKIIFILTGAGVSRESGIKTFREKDGLWDNHKIEDICTIETFQKKPNYVNNFYNERRKSLFNPDDKGKHYPPYCLHHNPPRDRLGDDDLEHIGEFN